MTSALDKLLETEGDALVAPDFEEDAEHHGVKGMKWGVRKDRGGTPSPRAARKQVKRDAKALKKTNRTAYRQSRSDYNNAYNAAQAKVNLRSKAEKKERDKKHLEAVLNEAIKSGDRVIIETPVYSMVAGTVIPMAMTGRDFTRYMGNGGAVKPRDTFIRSGPDGGYKNKDHANAIEGPEAKALERAQDAMNQAYNTYKGRG